MSDEQKKLKKFQGWVREAKTAAEDWRADAWRCQEAVDGKILTDEEHGDLIDAGITPEDINRIFPVVQLIKGMEIVNKQDINAKARTHKDSEASQNMTEGVKFVLDQNQGGHNISRAFGMAVDAGLGYIRIGKNPDPRKERIRLRYTDWKGAWSDPFASGPWLNTDDCRYNFYNPFIDLDELKAMWPGKAKDIDEQFKALADNVTEVANSSWQDEAETVEEEKLNSREWVDTPRKRCRPVEMWYTVNEAALFAVMPDGRAVEITEDITPVDQFQLIKESTRTVPATVKKMRTCTFFGDVILDDDYSDLPHDEFDLVPYVGHVDRFGFPYGVPRQIIGQNVEVIKRRAMALALLKARRVQFEKGALLDESPAGIEAAYEEYNKIDGMVGLQSGGLNRVKVEEMGQLANAQLSFLQQSEAEIQEISGANNEQMGYQGNAQSGKAIGMKQAQGATIMAPVMQNYRSANHRVGEHVIALIQGEWTSEKVLRVTDRMTGADRVIELNKKVERPGGTIEVKNSITEGRYDVVVTDAPQTDTVREQNVNLLMTVIEKAPQEAAPILMKAVMELMDLPNKEMVLEQLKPLFGGNLPLMEDMSKEDIKAQQEEQMKAKAEEDKMVKAIEQKIQELGLNKIMLENEELKAKIQKIIAEAEGKEVETDIKEEQAGIDNYKTGYELGKDMRDGSQPSAQAVS